MENLCKNCKYWEISERYPIKDTKIGKCKRIGMFWESTEWLDTDADDWDLRVLCDENKDDKAFAQDGSDYNAFLLTLENFGCVQFEK